MKTILQATLLATMLLSYASTGRGEEQPVTSVPQVTWDEQSLLVDGRRVVPAMGEVHYSRIPAQEWERAVQQMKEGGITMLACYVFWNHIVHSVTKLP